MTRYLLFPLLILIVAIQPSVSSAQGKHYFQKERSYDLKYRYGNPETSSVVVQNKAGEKHTVYVGDFVGSDKAKIYEVRYRHMTLQTRETIVDKDGNQYEQLGRMNMQLYAGVCLQNMLPWLNGGWELTYDSDNSKTDWMFFNNKTCQFGLMLSDGRVTGAPEYEVREQGDGTLTIHIEFDTGQLRPVYITLTVSYDHSRIYNESGAYYTKVTDNYRDINDRTFRKRRLAISGK